MLHLYILILRENFNCFEQWFDVFLQKKKFNFCSSKRYSFLFIVFVLFLLIL